MFHIELFLQLRLAFKHILYAFLSYFTFLLRMLWYDNIFKVILLVSQLADWSLFSYFLWFHLVPSSWTLTVVHPGMSFTEWILCKGVELQKECIKNHIQNKLPALTQIFSFYWALCLCFMISIISVLLRQEPQTAQLYHHFVPDAQPVQFSAHIN